jgi:hypothetical protein
MTHDDVDELVQWVSSKDIRREATLLSANEDPDKHSKHKEEKIQDIGMSNDDGSVSQLDVQDLVQHARKTSGDKTAEPAPPAEVEVGDLRALRNEKAGTKPKNLQGELNERKEELGMTLDEGPLSNSDVQDLVAHVRKI